VLNVNADPTSQKLSHCPTAYVLTLAWLSAIPSLKLRHLRHDMPAGQLQTYISVPKRHMHV
jgi:hypothetical protein